MVAGREGQHDTRRYEDYGIHQYGQACHLIGGNTQDGLELDEFLPAIGPRPIGVPRAVYQHAAGQADLVPRQNPGSLQIELPEKSATPELVLCEGEQSHTDD